MAIPEHRPQIADINKMLNMVEPIIVPRPMSPSPMNTDAMAMNRVGMELPAAINVAPATSVGIRSLEKEETFHCEINDPDDKLTLLSSISFL